MKNIAVKMPSVMKMMKKMPPKMGKGMPAQTKTVKHGLITFTVEK